MLLNSLLLFPLLLLSVSGAKIGFFFALSTYSHRIVVWPLVEKLAAKGHQVTFIQSFKPKKPNPAVKEFFPKALEKVGEEFESVDLLSLRLDGGWDAIAALSKEIPKVGLRVCEQFLADPETKAWIAKEKTFDLFVIDALMNDCAFGLSHVFKAKTILFGTSHPFGWWVDTFGLPAESSSIPDIMVPYRQPLSLYQKGLTSLTTAIMYLQKQFEFYPELDKLNQKYFNDPNFPTTAELERKTSLVFTNTHFSEEYSRSLPPLIVPIGGIHCEDGSQKLTKELETFINASDHHGVIYISFGSAAKISKAAKEFQNIFYTALANSKAKFVWKFEGERPKEMPPNVYTNSWLPQQAILAHPKVKGFLTHGGLLGMQEAVWHAVPLLPMPIFAEQDYNAIRVEESERGVMLDPNTLTVGKLQDAIHQLTTNSKYKKNMERTSRLFKDRPNKPVDTAVWWTEYVLRHSEEDLNIALKPPGMNQTWYQRRLLDVWGLVFLLLTLSFLLLGKILKFLCRLTKGREKSASVPKKVKRK